MAKKKSRKRQQKIKNDIKYEFFGIMLLAIMLIELNRLGNVGILLNSFFRLFIGSLDFVISLFGVYIAIYMMVKRVIPYKISMKKIGVFLILLAIVLNAQIIFVESLHSDGQASVISLTWDALSEERINSIPIDTGGGLLGAVTYQIFNYLFDIRGTNVMVVVLGLLGFLLTFNFSYVKFFNKVNSILKKLLINIGNKTKTLFEDIFSEKNDIDENKNVIKAKKQNKEIIKETKAENKVMSEEPIIHDFLNHPESKNNQLEKNEIKNINNSKISDLQRRADTHDIDIEGIPLKKIKEEEENYLMPPFQLLNIPDVSDSKDYYRDISDNAKKLESTLGSFGVKVKVTQIHRGPTVTRYEIQPDIGVKVSRIVNLGDDIALSLAAKDIRIEAPIPGKSAIGIEVPNTEVSIVTLREVIESQKFYENQSKLSIALGRDVSGEPIIADLAKMPHILVAGATGSGKSVCINIMINSILYKAKPSEVKLLLIDPKVVELNVYNGIPHLLTPVVTDSRQAARSLKMIVSEMDKRYEKFSEKGARDIERYNEIVRHELNSEDNSQQLLPYIVVIIDELADLMMVAPKDVEDTVIRLAQKARAAGIHLIVATQRPSVDVITGLIKANIPSRIAFGVSSQIDSRTIIDSGGAEKLLGRGDMLYLPVGFTKPIRIQGAYISDVEVEQVVGFIKEQQGAEYREDMITDLGKVKNQNEVEDDLYFDAIKIIVESNQASVSLLQRRLRIGYTRAARLIDEMESKGIVGPYEGSKPRKVLITQEQFQQISI